MARRGSQSQSYFVNAEDQQVNDFAYPQSVIQIAQIFNLLLMQMQTVI